MKDEFFGNYFQKLSSVREYGETLEGAPHLADLLSLCECFEPEFPEDASRVKDLVNQAVVRYRSVSGYGCGLNIYAPFRQSPVPVTWGDFQMKAYRQLGFCPAYTEFMNAFLEFLSGK